MKNLFCLSILSLLMLILSVNISIYAEDITVNCCDTLSEEIDFKCGTSTELIQELSKGLIQKKITVLNSEKDPWDSNITAFSIPFGVIGRRYMPSTGDVKMLTLPIEFQDEKLDENIVSHLQEVCFEKHDIANTQYKNLSICDYFEKVSFNKLRLSGMVLPIYSAAENREYYEKDRNLLMQEIAKAIMSNKDIIGDLSQYDYDNNGYIDCLNVVWAGNSGEWSGPWWGALHSGIDTDLYDGKKIHNYVGMSESEITMYAFAHEICHAMGLPDNYNVNSNSCVISSGCFELMQGNGYHINALYKYLLDWETPEILPYEDITFPINLYASDIYVKNESKLDKKRSIVFLPDSKSWPFTEFYIAEYRNYYLNPYTYSPGIIIWHCNTQECSYMQGTMYENGKYIRPIYKSGDDNLFKNEDLYHIDDEWSSETTPSSNFYDDIYTGAYMKVLSMDNEKATIQAGFKNPDLTPAPVLTISPPVDKCINSSKNATWYYSYSDYDEMNISLISDINWITTGTVTNLASRNKLQQYICANNLKGDGTIQLEIKPGTARKGAKYSNGAISEVVIVDNTPPEIKLNGGSEVELEYGGEYIEQGAAITDNLDPDIESKLKIAGTVNTKKNGTYTVTYNAADHAGNKAKQVIRTVRVLAPIITFENYDGTELQSERVSVGMRPVYKGETPKKQDNDMYSYEFSGWSPLITAVSGAATYTAQFKEIPKEYTVTLNTNDGEVNKVVLSYTYGKGLELPLPEKEHYVFEGWYDNEEFDGEPVTEISKETTGDKLYYAKWREQEYCIRFVNYDNSELQSSNVKYGEMPSYVGEMPIRPDDDMYSYTFIGWNPEVEAVSGEAVYTAKFEGTPHPTPTPTIEPTPTPTVTPSPTPTITPSPTPTGTPVVKVTPTPTVTPSPIPTVVPTATPSTEPTLIPTVIPSPSPTPEPKDRVEFITLGNLVSAKLMFEKTSPPKQEDIQVYVVYREDSKLKRVEMPVLTDMTFGFVIPEQFKNCDISVYVWDKNMIPLMNVQKVDI